jgi:carboxymethylenebutenolidase
MTEERSRGVLTSAGGVPILDCSPDERPRRAVVVLHDAAGATGQNDDFTGRFADLGYRAVAPQLYYRAGDRSLDHGDIEGMVRQMKALNDTDLLADLRAIVGYLSDEGFDDRAIGLVGFCMGGTIGLFGARHLALGAAVTFYGGGIVDPEFGIPPLLDLAPDLRTPWLGLYGDLDRLAPVEEVERLRSAAGRSPVPTALHRYAEAGHAFQADRRPTMYHEASAQDAWEKTLQWLDEHVVTSQLSSTA